MPAIGSTRSGSVIRMVVAFAVCLILLGIATLVVLGRSDVYGPGSIHDASLVRTSPDCAYWSVTLDVDHRWRNTEDVPRVWSGSIAGQLRIVDKDHATFAAEGHDVPMWGGDLRGTPRKFFTADCPLTLSR